MRVISEIWIINPNGITLFNKSEGGDVDGVLLGGFFSALQSFLIELGEKKLKSIVLGNTKFTIYQTDDGYLFISRSNIKVKEGKIEKKLLTVQTKFFEMYGDILKNWDSNAEIFKDFEKEIQSIFTDTAEQRAIDTIW